jgi:hypothetical protein
MTLGQAIAVINNCPGKRLADIALKDLLLPFNDLKTARGIYIFKHQNNFFYIGKNSARSFLERIGSHLDVLQPNPFQRLLDYYYKTKFSNGKEPQTEEELKGILPLVINEIYFVIIPFEAPIDKVLIGRVERNLLFGNTNAENKHRSRMEYLARPVTAANGWPAM